MARNKPTIQRDSVFRFGDQTQPATPNQPEGVQEQAAVSPPHETGEKTLETLTGNANHQTSVWFSDEEIDWLDAHCQTIRRSGWRGVKRSAFVRALIQALKEKRLDVAGVTNEQELVEAIRQSL
jgi:hypothetical protein